MDRALRILDRRLDPSSRAPLAVALSGGSDSTALLLLALHWAKAHDRPVLALTVDHQLQPPSAAWTRQASETALRLGAQARALAWTGDKPTTGIPAAARRARHALIAEAAREAGASVILFGHTLDDLAEVQAMRAEGSSVGSPRDWSPSPVWPEGRGLFLCRPMLGERRQVLRDWLRAQGIGWIDDPANADSTYARARARARAALGGAASVTPAPEGGLMAGAAQVRADVWGGLSAPLGALSRPLLQAMLACAAGREAPPRSAKVEALLERLHGGTDRAVLGGSRVSMGQEVSIWREPGERMRGGLAAAALSPRQVTIWDGRFEMKGLGEVGPLAGRAARLPLAQRQALKAAPPEARGALPLVRSSDGRLTCPVLAEDRDMECRPLAWDRFRAACGFINGEVGRDQSADSAMPAVRLSSGSEYLKAK